MDDDDPAQGPSPMFREGIAEGVPDIDKEDVSENTGEVEEGPDDEIPGCAVPEARDQKNNRDIEDFLNARAFASAHRFVDVVDEEAVQRDVPASPKIRHALTEQGESEVFTYVDAHHSCGTNGDVAIGAEVSINQNIA